VTACRNTSKVNLWTYKDLTLSNLNQHLLLHCLHIISRCASTHPKCIFTQKNYSFICYRINASVFVDLNCTTLPDSHISLQINTLFIITGTILLTLLLLSSVISISMVYRQIDVAYSLSIHRYNTYVLRYSWLFSRYRLGETVKCIVS